MTTYWKCWLFNAVWLLALLIVVGTLVWSYLNGGSQFGGEPIKADLSFIGLAAFGVMLVLGFVANNLPKCPHCEHPVNMADVTDTDDRWWTGPSLPFMRPQRPPRVCGYCGLDLTVPYNPE